MISEKLNVEAIYVIGLALDIDAVLVSASHKVFLNPVQPVMDTHCWIKAERGDPVIQVAECFFLADCTQGQGCIDLVSQG